MFAATLDNFAIAETTAKRAFEPLSFKDGDHAPG